MNKLVATTALIPITRAPTSLGTGQTTASSTLLPLRWDTMVPQSFCCATRMALVDSAASTFSYVDGQARSRAATSNEAHAGGCRRHVRTVGNVASIRATASLHTAVGSPGFKWDASSPLNASLTILSASPTTPMQRSHRSANEPGGGITLSARSVSHSSGPLTGKPSASTLLLGDASSALPNNGSSDASLPSLQASSGRRGVHFSDRQASHCSPACAHEKLHIW
mmetsp:Transcript_11720/g.30064  ORF Transcript_11720/g.30064 Transcript_11720/m.30064 type:complete len:224 (-) Transcript_11720:58-729(-)